MQYTTTSQEIFETFYISKTHKKHLKIDENNKIIYFTYPEKEVEINEEYVTNLGFNSDEICWMYGEEIDIFEHNGILM